MKLWQKANSIDSKVDSFTVGKDREYDLILVQYDCKASIAHANMLAKVGLLTKDEAKKLTIELKAIAQTVENGTFSIPDSFEDMHSRIEFLLTEKLGALGKKIHTARSRNDQVLVALQLYVKEEIQAIKKSTFSLFELLLELAKKNKEVLLPGYTHMQVAMPSSFGLWFSAYAETLIDDLVMFNAAFAMADQNPLGSAAGFGTSFPIDRKATTYALEFSDLKYNVVAAQMGRGKVEKAAIQAVGQLGATLSKLAMDICLYMGQDFDFIHFPEKLTTGSSIMPHKKNPDIFELIRGKCNLLQGLPHQLSLLNSNLPSGYHREMQLAKGLLIEAFQEIKSCLDMFQYSLAQIEVNKNLLELSKYDYLFSVDTLNEWVKGGMPFREAYKKMSEEIAAGNYKPEKRVSHSHLGSIGNLALEAIRSKMQTQLD